MHKKILPFTLKLIKENDLIIKLIDVGCRNGVQELASLAEFIEAYGFEPNPVEYDKLISGKTDALILCNVKPPKYKKIKYHALAISNRLGEDEFYVTPGPGACGLKEPDMKSLDRVIWKGKRYKKNFGEDIFADYKKIKVKTKTLDSFISEQSFNHIDYLKIDVEGSEYEVLEGAKDILLNTGVIKVEICFIPFRKEQKLFSDVDILLRDLGFELLKYEIESAHIGYKEREKPIYYTPISSPDPFGQPLSCDAIYVNRNLTDSKRGLWLKQ